MRNKKGIGDVIATVLLILIAIAAVVFAWTFIRVVIVDTTEDIDSAPAQLSPALSITGVDKEGDILLVKRELGIGKTSDVEVVGLRVVLEDAEGDIEDVIERNITIEKLETVAILGISFDDAVKVFVYPIFVNTEGKRLLGSVPGTARIEDDIIVG